VSHFHDIRLKKTPSKYFFGGKSSLQIHVTLRLILDLYPLYVLLKVFVFIEMKEITSVFDEPFLLHSSNVKSVIHHTLERRFCY